MIEMPGRVPSIGHGMLYFYGVLYACQRGYLSAGIGHYSALFLGSSESSERLLHYNRPSGKMSAPATCVGANATGIDSVFVAGGIHAEELGVSKAQLIPKQERLQGLIQEHSATPQYCMPFLR